MRLIRWIMITGCLAGLVACGSPEERAAEHLATAQKLYDAGDYVGAKLEAKNAAQIEPKNAKVRYLLALLAEEDGQPREMLKNLLMAAAEDPQMLDAHLKLGTLFVFAQSFGAAAEQAEAAMALAPDNPDVKVLNARLRIQQGDAEAGNAFLDEALALDPLHVEAVGMKALSLHENDPDEAVALLDAAIEQLPLDDSQPLRRLKLDILSYHERTQDLEQALLAMIEDAPEDDPTYQNRLARFYRNQGRMDDAEALLRDVAESTGDDVGAKLNVVQFLAEAREFDKAAATLQAFIEDDPGNQQLKLALGELYQANDDFATAVEVYEKVAADDPMSESGLLARTRLASERLRNGDGNGARELLNATLADAPDFPPALLLRAGLLYDSTNYDDAVADLRVLLRREPDNQRALLLMARSHAASANPILAKDTYRRILDLNPQHGPATKELVALMLRDDELDEAQSLLNQLAERGSGGMDTAVALFEVLARKGDLASAEKEARRLAAGDDANGMGAFLLGQALEGQQRYPQAAEAYRQALARNPSSVQVLQGLARTLKAQGETEAMLALLRLSVADHPENPGIRLMLGGALAEQGEANEALSIYESVIADYPTMSAAYVAVAALYPDDADRRIAAYRQGLAALPGDLVLASRLAPEYQQAGRIDDLIGLFERLLESNPDNSAVANNLAGLLADHRYQDPASLQRAVELAGTLTGTDDPLIMDTVGWTYYRGGQNDLALRYLERAVAGTTPLPVMRYHLGMAYLAAGDRSGAKQELAKAVGEANADFTGIEEARTALASLDDA